MCSRECFVDFTFPQYAMHHQGAYGFLAFGIPLNVWNKCTQWVRVILAISSIFHSFTAMNLKCKTFYSRCRLHVVLMFKWWGHRRDIVIYAVWGFWCFWMPFSSLEHIFESKLFIWFVCSCVKHFEDYFPINMNCGPW